MERMQQQKPEPASLTGLPQEVRDLIFGFALVAPEAIVVYAANIECYGCEEHKNHPCERHEGYRLVHVARDSALDELSLSLLTCGNTSIARQAADVFYSQNTFAFLGDHDWDPIISWLQSIGEENRKALSKLSIEVRKPRYVQQDEEGSRTAMEETFWPVYGLNPNLSTNLNEPFIPGMVENINPAIETLMTLLGNRQSQSPKPLQLDLLLEFDNLPGDLMSHGKFKWAFFTSTNLPDLLQRFRERHASDPQTQSPVGILWKAETYTATLDYPRNRSMDTSLRLIDDAGWDLIERNEISRHPIQMPGEPDDNTDQGRPERCRTPDFRGHRTDVVNFNIEWRTLLWRTTKLVLKRRAVEGEIWAARPVPFRGEPFRIFH